MSWIRRVFLVFNKGFIFYLLKMLIYQLLKLTSTLSFGYCCNVVDSQEHKLSDATRSLYRSLTCVEYSLVSLKPDFPLLHQGKPILMLTTPQLSKLQKRQPPLLYTFFSNPPIARVSGVVLQWNITVCFNSPLNLLWNGIPCNASTTAAVH